MTANDFAAECAARDIYPGIALENAAVRVALSSGDRAAVIAALDT